jgi:uncharacterized membrane protein YedE/YeeE
LAIDWTHFTPWSALAGGALIGLAAVLLAALAGRVAGISGIVGGLLRPHPQEAGWRIAFVAGLMMAPAMYALFGPGMHVEIDASNATLVVAGLLVGAGTRLGSGCTSGHGVCGLARRSPRSAVATATFMAAGFFTVFLTRHVFA